MGKGAAMSKNLIVSLGVLLAACGGADGRNLAERFDLQAQAQAWENQMPSVIAPGQQPSCTPLIVQFTLVAKQSLPVDIAATSVSLAKNGSVAWTQDVSATETGLRDDKTLQGVARGCATAAFSEGDVLVVNVLLKSAAEQAQVQTTAQLLFAS
jgi:hypothetical protein